MAVAGRGIDAVRQELRVDDPVVGVDRHHVIGLGHLGDAPVRGIETGDSMHAPSPRHEIDDTGEIFLGVAHRPSAQGHAERRPGGGGRRRRPLLRRDRPLILPRSPERSAPRTASTTAPANGGRQLG